MNFPPEREKTLLQRNMEKLVDQYHTMLDSGIMPLIEVRPEDLGLDNDNYPEEYAVLDLIISNTKHHRRIYFSNGWEKVSMRVLEDNPADLDYYLEGLYEKLTEKAVNEPKFAARLFS